LTFLDTGVGDDRRAVVLTQVLASGDEHLAGRGGIQAGGEGPSKDLPAVVVDHGVKEGLRPVEQLEDRDIDSQYSFGRLARTPSVGLAGCTRMRGRR